MSPMDHSTSPPRAPGSWRTRLEHASMWQKGALGLLLTGILAAAMLVILVSVATAIAYPQLPDINELTDYRPKLPMRVYSVEGDLLGEFGEERRKLVRIKDIPQTLREAVLAAEDARFFSHGGVDYIGVLRAGITNLWNRRAQGASTITMQVARNVYLSRERTLRRKFYELLLAFRLEATLSKDQILEIYMNQIFLGNRSYGFAAAAEAYFGKPLGSITIAEAAMLAGLPKAPTAYNPFVNPARARARQLYVMERMQEEGYITPAQMQQAKAEPLHLRPGGLAGQTHADFVAEMVRQLVYPQYGAQTYTRGLHVHTTIRSAWQVAAYKALREGLMNYERRRPYRGPEEFIALSNERKIQEEQITEALQEHPDNADVYAAVVLHADPKRVVVERANAEVIEITSEGLALARAGLSSKAEAKVRVVRGAIVRIAQTPRKTWEIVQLPEVEGAFVAVEPASGAIASLVGGFDFQKNQFNHATQAWRQPGSSFKPFIYSAALERGLNGATVMDDAPLFFGAAATGAQAWEPKNYDGKFAGPMTLRRALAASKNMISIQVLQHVGPRAAQEWLTHFGFDAQRHPPYLTLALGAGLVTPLQMATAYSVFANGGHRLDPWLISRITDETGRVLVQTEPQELGESNRVIDARNAFVMSSLLQEVTRSGTAARAQATLQRSDLYGKTGTTNDSHDTWFAGYSPSVTGVVWIGYDTPRSLGDRETGGGLSLPVWISFMQTALKGTAVHEYPLPEGVLSRDGEWVYTETTSTIGLMDGATRASPNAASNASAAGPATGDSPAAPPGTAASGTAATPYSPPPPISAQERKSILDLFK